MRISGSRNTNTCLFEQLVSIDSAIAIVVSLSIYRYEQLNKETVVTSKQSKAKKEERKWGESLWWSLRAGLIDASSAELTWPLQMISSPGPFIAGGGKHTYSIMRESISVFLDNPLMKVGCNIFCYYQQTGKYDDLVLQHVNFTIGTPEERMMLSGLHTVADIFCCCCGQIIGWKYESAHEKSQKYKEGKFVLERGRIVDEVDFSTEFYIDSHASMSDAEEP
ncbi:Protein yippee-like [Glycine max]|nr:Protein yippee-like [Glycine max]